MDAAVTATVGRGVPMAVVMDVGAMELPTEMAAMVGMKEGAAMGVCSATAGTEEVMDVMVMEVMAAEAASAVWLVDWAPKPVEASATKMFGTASFCFADDRAVERGNCNDEREVAMDGGALLALLASSHSKSILIVWAARGGRGFWAHV